MSECGSDLLETFFNYCKKCVAIIKKMPHSIYVSLKSGCLEYKYYHIRP